MEKKKEIKKEEEYEEKMRIQKYLDAKGINTRQFEIQTGLSNGYWRKTKSISAHAVSMILKTYKDLSARWVLFGEGVMCCSNSSDEEIYTKVSKDDKITLLEDKVKFLEEQVTFYKNK